MNRRSGFSFLVLALLTAAIGCGDDSSYVCTVPGDAQPRRRLPAGTAFYLGLPDEAACADLRWQLEAAPPDSRATVAVDSAGRARLTPVVPGQYRLRIGDSDTVETLTVIDPTTVPFHNYNYYATASLALVDDELWVANVFSPTVSRVDPTSLTLLGELVTGPWPVALAWQPGMQVALVAHRANDTLGVIDVATRELIDSIWVGDEPANIALSPDGATAYVALSTQSHVAVVDLATRELVGELPALPDVRGLALTSDGATLFAARYRSGSPERFPYEDQSVADEVDIVAIDVASASITRRLLDVGTTISDLALSDDDARLYISSVRNDPEAPLADTSRPSWFHSVLMYDAATGDELASADLSRQPGSGGRAVLLYDLMLAGDSLWVVAEASDLAIELDPSTLAERARFDAPGRPRSLAVVKGDVFAHGSLALTLQRVRDGASVTLAADPRPASMARGQAYFTGPGERYGVQWSCNSCHPDGLTDGMVWLAGPTDAREMSRPLTILDATKPLGWGGYMSSAENFALETTSNIGTRPTTQEAIDLGAYLVSLMAPPAATQTTLRDGSLSKTALRGKALFEGEAGCVGCHSGPALTTGSVFPEGITPGASEVPTLVGAYRFGAWLKHGEAQTLRDAVLAASEWSGAPALSDAQLDDLLVYLGELSGRDFYLATTTPALDVPLPTQQPIELRFSQPVYAPSAAAVTLLDDAGARVDASVAVDGNRVTVTPSAPLAAGASYRIAVGDSLESFSERPLLAARELAFSTAAAPSLRLEGSYELTFDLPSFNPTTGEFDEDNTVAFSVAMRAPGGDTVVLDYGGGLERATLAVVDGDRLRVPPLPVPVSRSFAEGLSGLDGPLVDGNGDGVADSASGTLRVTGPGLDFPKTTWSMRRPVACDEGQHGSVAVTIDRTQDPPVFAWGDVTALGLYVTDPAATLPTGPGTSVGGVTYWAIELVTFPMGFAGPVTYGVVPDLAVDRTEDPNGGTFGPLEEGTCYKVSVVTTAFQIGDVVVRW